MDSVSFIVPSYNEANNVLPFYNQFAQVFDNFNLTWDLIFVDDGSKDDTFQKLTELAEKFSNVLAIRFSRNFGKDAAIWAGLQNAKGNIVGIIDADLQQPPEDALKMVEILISNPEYDCVAAYQENRGGGLLQKQKAYSIRSSQSYPE